MSEALPQLNKLDCVAVGISPDLPEKQLRFAQKYDLKIPLLSDPERKTVRAYGAWGTKNMYGKQVEGMFRSAFLLDGKGRVIGAWYKIKPDATVPKALEILEG